MAGLVRTVLDLKSEVESMKKIFEVNHKDDVEKLIEKQKIVDEEIAANKAAISKIDKEILVLSEVDQSPKQNDTIEDVGMVNEVGIAGGQI